MDIVFRVSGCNQLKTKSKTVQFIVTKANFHDNKKILEHEKSCSNGASSNHLTEHKSRKILLLFLSLFLSLFFSI